jgi:hypothetical protein
VAVTKPKDTDLPLVVVRWDDAWTTETPASLDGHLVHKPERVTTIGWLLKDDAVGIQLANEFYDETYRGRTFVPRAMIVTVTPFKLAKVRQVKITPEETPLA